MKKPIRVAITSIGSGVGQSIINSCRLSELSLYVVGLGSNPMAFGQYDCDMYDTLPSIYSEEYIDYLLEQCKKYQIDILIPGLDNELYNISKNTERFLEIGVRPIISSTEMIELCRNKLKMSCVMSQLTNSFVISYDKELLIEAYNKNEITFPLIAKPLDGFASSGLLVIHSAEDFHSLSNNHVIQEIAIPHKKDINYTNFMSNLEKRIVSQVSEVSVQFVISKDGNIIGKCATFNKLNNGVPTEIIPFDDPNMWKDLEKIIPYFIKIGLKGPLNIQGRMTENGPKWFEMNARFTGITGLRAMMGFNEVEAMIKDTYEMTLTPREIKLNNKRIGMRQVSDRVVEFGRNIDLDNLITKTGYYPLEKNRKSVMVTGATGFLGIHIVKKLLDQEEIESVICFVRNKDKAFSIYGGHTKVKIVSILDIEQGLFNFGSIDVLIHTAFGLVKEGYEAIAKSLDYTSWIFYMARSFQVPAVINISSQSVYGLSKPPLWHEDDSVAPETPYAQAKWAGELMISTVGQESVQTRTTSIRLSALMGPGIGMRTYNLPFVFMEKALEDGEIMIKGGTQSLDLLDVRDAADGIISLLNIELSKWKPIYNIGSGKPINIIDIALKANHAAKLSKGKFAKITIQPDEINLNFGMSIERIEGDTAWYPKIPLIQSFEDMVNYI